MKAYIYLENGVFLEAKAFGKGGSVVANMVFNTSFTAYQEIITDPSYEGKFIVFTSPEIGIVGTNSEDSSSDKIHASSILIRSFNKMPSNFRATKDLEEFFKDNEKFGVYDVDTRFLTTLLREKGELRAAISTEISNSNDLKQMLDNRS